MYIRRATAYMGKKRTPSGIAKQKRLAKKKRIKKRMKRK